MDVIREVAKMECLAKPCECDSCGGQRPVCHAPDCICRGTGLRWPLLSRVCGLLPVDDWRLINYGDFSNVPRLVAESKHEDCPRCTDGLVPTVTLEKILNIVDTLKLDKYCDGWQCWIVIEGNGWTGKGYGVAEYPGTPLEAACAALLAC